MEDGDNLLELMILVGHRARVGLEHLCAACDGRVASEVLLLRTLRRLGQQTRRNALARALGWNPSRVNQVVDRLIEKEHVRRLRGHWLTETGAEEAALGGALLHALEEAILDGLDAQERRGLLDSLRRVAGNSERQA